MIAQQIRAKYCDLRVNCPFEDRSNVCYVGFTICSTAPKWPRQQIILFHTDTLHVLDRVYDLTTGLNKRLLIVKALNPEKYFYVQYETVRVSDG